MFKKFLNFKTNNFDKFKIIKLIKKIIIQNNLSK